jgi:parallel beta-helix repeat protein
MKKLTSWIIITLVLCTAPLTFSILPVFAPSSAAIARIYVSPPEVRANLNSNVTINIVIENVVNMAGYEIKLYWDTSTLQSNQWNYTSKTWIQNPSTPPYSSGQFETLVNNITNMLDGRSRYWISLTSKPPTYGDPLPSVSGTFTVVKLNFKVISLSETLLDLADTVLGDPTNLYQSIPHSVADGMFLATIPGAIYIQSDGSINPPSAPIQISGNLYTLTNNIVVSTFNDGLVIERDNIVIDGAGHTLQGSGKGIGVTLQGRSNVTIKNMIITAFTSGIKLNNSLKNDISSNTITTNNFLGVELYRSSNNSISGNTVTSNNRYGIYLWNSSKYNIMTGNTVNGHHDYGLEMFDSANSNRILGNQMKNNYKGIGLHRSSANSIIGNNVSANNYLGIFFGNSSSNVIFGNNIANKYFGIVLGYSSNSMISGNNVTKNNVVSPGLTPTGILLAASSSNNIIYRNKIAENYRGISFFSSSGNSIHHNNFVSNNFQAHIEFSVNVWDNGYPSGGNYWSDYTGVDSNSDGIGDTPYVIDAQNQDKYPFMNQVTPLRPTQHNIAVLNVVTSKTIVGLGYVVRINTTIVNLSYNTETFNMTVYRNTTAINTITGITLTSGNFTTLPTIWNTTGTTKAKYTIKSYATPVPGETETADNTFIDGTVQVTKPGDINGDNNVNVLDLIIVASALGTRLGDPEWKPNADIKEDNIINVLDLILIASYLGT